VIFMSISWDLVEFYWDTMENDRENWNHAWFCWENLQETNAFPILDRGSSSNLSLQRIRGDSEKAAFHKRKSLFHRSIKHVPSIAHESNRCSQ
jgi:hypothetical protein